MCIRDSFNGDIQRVGNETYGDAYVTIGDSSGFNRVGQEAFMGYVTYLVDNGDTDFDYMVNAEILDSYQEIDIVQSGSKGKTSLNLSGAFTSGLHLGANLNLHWFERNRSMNFYEENAFSNVSYTFFDENVSGGGVSLALGGIYKTKENLRIGFSYQTPTWYSVLTSYDVNLDVDFVDAITVIDDDGAETELGGVIVDPGLISDNGDTYIRTPFYDDLPEYTYRTPGKLTASLAYVIGKKGLISAEYSRQNFGNIKYGDELVGYDVLNQTIEELYNVVNTFRLGSEVRLDKWSLRAGGWNKSSQFQDEETFGGGSFGYSLGAGYNWGKWQLDASYNHFEREYSVTPFENDLYSNTAITTEKGDLVSVTLGVNF